MDRLLRASFIPLGLLTIGSLSWFAIHSRQDPATDVDPLSASKTVDTEDGEHDRRYPPEQLDVPEEVAPINFDFSPEAAAGASDLASYRSFTEASLGADALSSHETPAEPNVQPLAPSTAVVNAVVPVESETQPQASKAEHTPPQRNSGWVGGRVTNEAGGAPRGSWTAPPVARNNQPRPPVHRAPSVTRLPSTRVARLDPSDAHRSAVIDTIRQESSFIQQPAPRPANSPSNARIPVRHQSPPAPTVTFTENPLVRPTAPTVTPRAPQPKAVRRQPARSMPRRNKNAIHAAVRLAEDVVKHGSSLATRNAYFSARQEFMQALQMIAEGLDMQTGGTTHTKKLASAFQALREAEDFVPQQGATWRGPEDLANIIEAHDTPVLKETGASSTPWMARQQYYQYAHQQLSQAVAGQPAASRALYCLGKLHMLLATQHQVRIVESGPKAMVFHQAALTVDPRNHPSANELGVLLARFSQFEDARKVLLHGLSISKRAEMWHNLSVVHAHLNEIDLARRAAHECQLVKNRRGDVALQHNSTDAVQWVDAQEFARMSPRPDAPVTTRQPITPQPQPQIRSAKQWWNPWK